MVPVKKPGRPLSACPHLNNQLCGCSSVTAAIPRKQKCHCGTGASAVPQLAVQPRPVPSAISDIPSPTKVIFRVQKPSLLSRPGSRKQSYDLSNLERMDGSNINITSYQTPATQPALGQAIPNGHSKTPTNGSYTNGSQRPRSSSGIQDLLLPSQYPDLSFPLNHTNGEYLAGYPASLSATFTSDGPYLERETHGESSLEDIKASGGASCCAAKPGTSNGNMAFEPQPYEIINYEGGSRSSRAPPTSSTVTPEISIVNGQSKARHYPFTDSFSTSKDVYSSFAPQPTIYEYPASYGSYQHPLQPSQWRRDFMSNIYAQPMLEPEMMNGPATFGSDIFPNLKTRHQCSCGDACQCIGCVAHPYNDATRKCVHSAYIMSHEPSSSVTGELINGRTNDTLFPSSSDPHANGNGHMHSSGEDISPPHGDTPSDSSTVEEQTLPASDYIFVNYPFYGDGCGGDTNNCPCGDECECIGCTIHRFDESSMALPSESWATEQMFTNGDGAELLKGITVKDENLIDELTDQPKKSCCE